MIIQWVCAIDAVAATGGSSSTFTAVVVMLVVAVIKVIAIAILDTTTGSPLAATIMQRERKIEPNGSLD